MPPPAPPSIQDVRERIQAKRAEIRALGVQRLGLFGSYVRGDQTPESDVDILIEFAPGMKTFRRFSELTALLESTLGHRVDVVTKESLSPYIGPRILREVHDVPV